MERMSALRATGVGLLAIVGLAFVAFGVDDVRMSQLPPMHQAYAERHGVVVSDTVVAMVLSVFAGHTLGVAGVAACRVARRRTTGGSK